jgi:outer membrane protein assembly factor BamA
LDAAKNGGFLGGDADYWTFTADVRRYIYLAERHSLALYGLATLQPGVVGQDIPVFGDYHLGGTNAVRGWDVDQREGKHQLLGTVEYRLLVLEPKRFRPAFLPAFLPAVSLPVGLQFAVFGDAGIVWDTASAFRWSSAVAGVGVGLRMLIPGFGMLRGDVAVGQPGFGIGLHFGVYEKAIGQRNRVR